MSELNPNSAGLPEQDQPASPPPENSNALQNEAIHQWQLDAIRKVADTNGNKKVSKDELKIAIDDAKRAPFGLAKLTSEEQEIAQQIYDKYDSVKHLDREKGLFADKEISEADFKKLVGEQLKIKQLDFYFDQRLQRLIDTGQMDDNYNQLDHNQIRYSGEVLKAMARGDEVELAHILDSYRSVREDSLLDSTSKVDEILKEKGGSITYSRKLGHPAFRNVIFPTMDGHSTNRMKGSGSYVPGLVIHAPEKKRRS